MSGEPGYMIGNILHDPKWTATEWENAIAQLVTGFQQFIGERCLHDNDPVIDACAPSFNIWLWSPLHSHSLLTTSWSGVMAGGLIGGEFVVTVDIFLFHSGSKLRMHTTDGGSYMQFIFNTQAGGWAFNGWMKDEWGEWEGVVFP